MVFNQQLSAFESSCFVEHLVYIDHLHTIQIYNFLMYATLKTRAKLFYNFIAEKFLNSKANVV